MLGPSSCGSEYEYLANAVCSGDEEHAERLLLLALLNYKRYVFKHTCKKETHWRNRIVLEKPVFNCIYSEERYMIDILFKTLYNSLRSQKND